jgi:hypothetical protein
VGYAESEVFTEDVIEEYYIVGYDTVQLWRETDVSDIHTASICRTEE